MYFNLQFDDNWTINLFYSFCACLHLCFDFHSRQQIKSFNLVDFTTLRVIPFFRGFLFLIHLSPAIITNSPPAHVSVRKINKYFSQSSSLWVESSKKGKWKKLSADKISREIASGIYVGPTALWMRCFHKRARIYFEKCLMFARAIDDDILFLWSEMGRVIKFLPHSHVPVAPSCHVSTFLWALLLSSLRSSSSWCTHKSFLVQLACRGAHFVERFSTSIHIHLIHAHDDGVCQCCCALIATLFCKNFSW